MGIIRRALLLASAERYIVMSINLGMMPIVARLMGPSEFGISVLGMAALMLAEALRDFGGSAYIIQAKRLSLAEIRTSFTIMAIWTISLTILLFLTANVIAQFYHEPGLARYLNVVAMTYLFGPFVSPVFALLRREMEYGKIAIVTVTSTFVYALAVIGLAALGFSYMSFAWGSFISGAVGAVLGLLFHRDFSIFRLSLSKWRRLTQFGGYESVAAMLTNIREFLPFLIFGRLLDAGAIGVFRRAMTICTLPQRALLGGLESMVLSGFSAHVREGHDLRDAYLHSVKMVSVVHWGSLMVVALLAHPIVAVLLGAQWMAVVPLVRIIALAIMLNFSVNLTYSALVVAGNIRLMMLLNIVVVPLMALFVFVTAHWGVKAAAYSFIPIYALEIGLSLYLVRACVPFTWRQLAVALWPSAAVTMITGVGPTLVVIWAGSMELSILDGFFAGGLAGVGWFGGMWLVEHPLWDEIVRMYRALCGWAGVALTRAANTQH
ncbi:MAG: oligosaccharide flippase family protein [Alphaproteobacteria bacterium]